VADKDEVLLVSGRMELGLMIVAHGFLAARGAERRQVMLVLLRPLLEHDWGLRRLEIDPLELGLVLFEAAH